MAQQQTQSRPQSSTASSNTSTISIPQTAAAGGLTITQPPQTATSFFKIAQNQLVTFGWNMTSVLVTPTHLTVSAVCDNGNTYPVGPTDGIIPGTATSVVWDVYSWQQNHPNTPLAQASYTLHIWDDRGPNPPRAGGYMQPNSALQFALYTPQPYTPISSGELSSSNLRFMFHVFPIASIIPPLHTNMDSPTVRLDMLRLQRCSFVLHGTPSIRRDRRNIHHHVPLWLQSSPPHPRHALNCLECSPSLHCHELRRTWRVFLTYHRHF